MANARVYVTPESIPGLHIRFDLMDSAMGRDVLDETAGQELVR
jgi:hypothetical protein